MVVLFDNLLHLPTADQVLQAVGAARFHKQANTECFLRAQVFDRVAREVVLGALHGVNGTVFAYGQTGRSLFAAKCCNVLQ